MPSSYLKEIYPSITEEQLQIGKIFWLIVRMVESDEPDRNLRKRRSIY